MTGQPQPIEPRGEPWPYSWPPEEHCHWHRAHEPWHEPEDGFIACGECGHLFRTAQELIEVYIKESPSGFDASNVKADEIYFCPYCTHDF